MQLQVEIHDRVFRQTGEGVRGQILAVFVLQVPQGGSQEGGMAPGPRFACLPRRQVGYSSDLLTVQITADSACRRTCWLNLFHDMVQPAGGQWAELVNGRWAMLGVAGMLLPEVFTKIGIINAPQWYDAGKAEYFASSSTLFVIEFILFHYVEIRRWQDIKYPGSVNQDPIFKSYSLPPNEVGYPGGIFNPLNFAPTLEAKEKELANGKSAL
ncbi:hypothetical protein BHE74_00000924 [Ensete ventricosum]|nr:hypothetical protein GW17_00021134 [Ensete ventricosum]RWW89982.1 hypothetical protein BHE74_00000924 [Ensete ventricosum]RZS11334.1 hypothetical protein BHM03_00042656 [Ensete ventricosum]